MILRRKSRIIQDQGDRESQIVGVLPRVLAEYARLTISIAAVPIIHNPTSKRGTGNKITRLRFLKLRFFGNPTPKRGDSDTDWILAYASGFQKPRQNIKIATSKFTRRVTKDSPCKSRFLQRRTSARFLMNKPRAGALRPILKLTTRFSRLLIAGEPLHIPPNPCVLKRDRALA